MTVTGLFIGYQIKDFEWIDQNCDNIQLSELLDKKEVNVIFDRGQ